MVPAARAAELAAALARPERDAPATVAAVDEPARIGVERLRTVLADVRRVVQRAGVGEGGQRRAPSRVARLRAACPRFAPGAAASRRRRYHRRREHVELVSHGAAWLG